MCKASENAAVLSAAAGTEVRFYSQTAPCRTRWLWEPYIPRGKVTIIQGDPGEGKSTLALALAAAVSRGWEFPTHRQSNEPALVLYQNAEDGVADTVRPRLDTAGADSDFIMYIREGEEPLGIIDSRFVRLLEHTRPALVVLDPLQAYLGSDVDMHRANEVRPVMTALSEMAEEYGCAVVLIGHMNKMQGSKSLYRGLGSIDLTAAARSVLLVAKDPADPDVRVIFQIKNSLEKMAEPAAFSLKDGRFTWIGAYEADLSELLSAEPKTDRPISRAKEFLRRWLTKEHPRIQQREILEMADSEGIKKRTLYTAKNALKIGSFKEGNCWFWCLHGSTPGE